jgi:hypothetical protein
MGTTFQTVEGPRSGLRKLLAISSAGCAVVFIALLGVMGMSLLPVTVATASVLVLWATFKYPTQGLGLFLAFIPTYTLLFLLAKFFGPPYIGALEGADRGALLLLAFGLWCKNGIHLTRPDWLLLACFGLATAHFIFGGSLLALLSDFNFVIAYAAGRLTTLDGDREQYWATRAVWIVSLLAVLGMVEVFIIGEGPRTVLYLAVSRGGTDGNALDAAFHAQGYLGLRESSTMFGPLQFAPLCMAALVIWWIYSRKTIPGLMLAAGLICTVTRSAWVGTAVALGFVSVQLGETRRLLKAGAVMLALFIAAIPVLGLTDYLKSTKSGEDPSAQGHRESIIEGIQFIAQHPFGVGPGNAGKLAVKTEGTAFSVEDTYLTFAAEYGIGTVICFIAFLVSLVRYLRPEPTKLDLVALGVVVGFSAVMTFAALHDVFPLACWLWFPVGLAVRSRMERLHTTADTAV